MSQTATVTWELPTVREQGGELLPADIAGVEVSLAIVGASFTLLELVPPDTLELSAPDLEPGDWAFQLIVVDTEGEKSVPVAAPFSVIDDSPPGIVTNVNVTLV